MDVLALILLYLCVHLPNNGLFLLNARDYLAVLVPKSYVLLLLLVYNDNLCFQFALQFVLLLFEFEDHLRLLVVELSGPLIDDLLQLFVDLLELGDFLGLHFIDVLEIADCLLVLLAFIDIVGQGILVLFDDSISFFLVLVLKLLNSLLLLSGSSFLLHSYVLLQLLAIHGVLNSQLSDFEVRVID